MVKHIREYTLYICLSWFKYQRGYISYSAGKLAAIYLSEISQGFHQIKYKYVNI